MLDTKYKLLGSSLLLCTTVLTVGCGGGGGGGAIVSSSSSTSVVPATSTTSVSGTTGGGSSKSKNSTLGMFPSIVAAPTASSDTKAILHVDKNFDGVLDENDLIYETAVLTDGSFKFDEVVVSKTAATKAQLTVKKTGYAPVVKTLALLKDMPVSILAEVEDIPVLRGALKLPEPSKRANTFLKFGITKSDNGFSTFTKLMTLSELKAEADIGLPEGTLSTGSIPASAFPDDVTVVTTKMQAFDSTNETDISHFPGSFSGHGKPAMVAGATDTTTENTLESAAFDLIQLTDQNGDAIELQGLKQGAVNKIGAQMDAASCTGMYWVRRVNSAQAKVIEAWGDDDKNASNGFQVPIWSNDNSTSSWEYVGLGDWNSTTHQFAACVDKKWQGYLNCDSEINIGTKPKELCIAVTNQFDEVVENGLTFNAKKGNTYKYGYLNNGKVTLSLASGTPDDWNVTYRGPMTGWGTVGIDDNTTWTTSSTQGCDYDMNVTVDDPYSADIYVFALDDKNATVSNVLVRLNASSYSDYYDRSAYTNAKGYAIFKVKPNVTYTAGYLAGTSKVNVNGSVNAPETADSGRYASVNVQDKEMAPTISLLYTPSNIKDTAQSIRFSITANDKNKDTISLKSLSLNGIDLQKDVDYKITYRYAYNGYLRVAGELDLNSTTMQGINPTSLKAGDYTIKADVTDGKLSTSAIRTFTSHANSAPIIDSVSIQDNDYHNYYINSAIPKGTYKIDFYAFDIDGDSITKTMKIDNNDYTPSDDYDLTAGDHNITAIATDENGKVATKEYSIYVGNHAPEIKSAGATRTIVDINKHEAFRLFALASDRDNDALTVTATDENNNTYTLEKVSSYGTKYQSKDIVLTAAKDVNRFTIVASDGDKNSTAMSVTVQSIAANQPPVFTKELVDQQVNVNTEVTLICEANDPEKTLVTYAWSLNGVDVSNSTTTYKHTFSSTGSNIVECTATDEDGKSSISSASILVIDPDVSGRLTVDAKYEGLIVSVHNSLDYNITQEKFTDANGIADFTVQGDRITFSITAWSDMEVHKKLLMDITKTEMLEGAFYSCENNSSKECKEADWCTILKAETIPNWVWDAGSGEEEKASDIDTDSDGVISADELYTAALQELDANGDGKLSYAEVNSNDDNEKYNRVLQNVYANVPARKYSIKLAHLGINPWVENEMCRDDDEDKSFTTYLTFDYSAVDSNDTKDIFISGSNYASRYNATTDSNNTISVGLSWSRKGDNDKYSYLLKTKDHNASEYHFYMLNDKTKADLDANITVDVAKFVPADKNVTFTKEKESQQISLSTQYQGLYMANEATNSQYTNDTSYSVNYYTHSGFVYTITTSDSHDNNWYWTYNYYKETTLNDTYDISDYPTLDVRFSVNNSDETWTFSGNDRSKVNLLASQYSAYSTTTDEKTEERTNNHLNISVVWTVAPSQMPKVALQNIVPQEVFADANATVTGDNFNDNMSLEAYEYKGATEDLILNALTGNGGLYGVHEELDFRDQGLRAVYAAGGVSGASTLSTDEMKSSVFMRNPFSIKLNANAFTK